MISYLGKLKNCLFNFTPKCLFLDASSELDVVTLIPFYQIVVENDTFFI